MIATLRRLATFGTVAVLSLTLIPIYAATTTTLVIGSLALGRVRLDDERRVMTAGGIPDCDRCPNGGNVYEAPEAGYWTYFDCVACGSGTAEPVWWHNDPDSMHYEPDDDQQLVTDGGQDLSAFGIDCPEPEEPAHTDTSDDYAVTRPQCRALTNAGDRCSNPTVRGTGDDFCPRHVDMDCEPVDNESEDDDDEQVHDPSHAECSNCGHRQFNDRIGDEQPVCPKCQPFMPYSSAEQVRLFHKRMEQQALLDESYVTGGGYVESVHADTATERSEPTAATPAAA